MAKLTTLSSRDELQKLYDGSAYTIAGCGGDINEWVTGISGALQKKGIGTPDEFFTFTGTMMNEFSNPIEKTDFFRDDLTFLAFPIDGLDTGKLAMFKLMMGDRWFDDIVDNITRRNQESGRNSHEEEDEE